MTSEQIEITNYFNANPKLVNQLDYAANYNNGLLRDPRNSLVGEHTVV